MERDAGQHAYACDFGTMTSTVDVATLPSVPGALTAGLRRVAPPRRDAALALSVAAATLVCVYTAPLEAFNGGVRAGNPLGILISLGMTLPLAWRRRRPLASLAVAGVFSVLSTSLSYATDPAGVFVLFGVGSAALYTNRRTTILLAIFSTTYQIGVWLAWASFDVAPSELTAALATGLLPPILGDALRVERAFAAARAERAERIHELEMLNAAEAERLRIARELHDIVGHHLSAIGVQARTIRTLVDSSADRARTELTALAQLASSALHETRSSVAALRNDSARHSPQPRLESLHELLEIAHAGGVEVDLRVAGNQRPLPGSTELCAYRVLQEALTNVRRHAARPACAQVTLEYRTPGLRLHVSNPLSCVDAAHGRGLGLVGMRERVELAGGTLRAGPTRDDRWEIVAHLPVAPR